MKLTFLGSGASEAVPSIFCDCKYCRKARELKGKNIRSRTSTAINDDLLVDFSPDTMDHIRVSGLEMKKIRNLLITHSHMDHFYPEELSHIAPPYNMSSDVEKMSVWGNEDVIQKIRERVETIALPYLDLHTIHNFETAEFGNYRITALPAKHDASEECHLYIIEDGSCTLLYAHDTAYFPEETWRELGRYSFDCVVLDCTCCVGPSVFSTHMGSDDNVRVKNRMLEEGMASSDTTFIATHFVHTYDPIQEHLEKKLLPLGIIPAYDGYSLEVLKRVADR